VAAPKGSGKRKPRPKLEAARGSLAWPALRDAMQHLGQCQWQGPPSREQILLASKRDEGSVSSSCAGASPARPPGPRESAAGNFELQQPQLTRSRRRPGRSIKRGSCVEPWSLMPVTRLLFKVFARAGA
jgi:hypothetical protein